MIQSFNELLIVHESVEIQDDFLHLEYCVFFPCFGRTEMQLVCSPFLQLWTTGTGRERKEKGTPFSVPLKHLLLSWLMYFAFTHSPAVFWKEEMWTWSHLACSGFLCTALTVVGVKKKRVGGRNLLWLWTDRGIFPPVNFFVTQLESISFLNCHTLPTSLSEYIMYIIVNVLLLWEGLTPCHHYLWNGAFTESKDFHWNLCIKQAEDWLLLII